MQPFAFQSREYLRNLLVGKTVSFEVLYQIPTTKREYGKVKFADGIELPNALVAEGWAKVRDDAGRKEDDEAAVAYLEKLRMLEEEAKSSSKGAWATSGGKIDTSYEVSDPNALVDQYSGKEVDAIVERVLTGDRMIVRLMLSPEKHLQTMLVLAGVRTPSTKRTSPDGKDVPAEPYGTEAHQFVEGRLHQRKCTVQLLGVTPQRQLVGHVIHPRGNIAKFLLEAGLARCHDQHVTLLGNEMAIFQKSRDSSKELQKGLVYRFCG